MAETERETWAVVGASRGIGWEFVNQLLDAGHKVAATVRLQPETPASLWPNSDGRCDVYECDMLKEKSIDVQISPGCLLSTPR